jgi:tripartite ATP-independent transporter DctM subunit
VKGSIEGALRGVRRIEDGLTAAALLLMALLPIGEFLLRLLFKTGIPDSAVYVQNLTLWVGFLGAMVAARERQHLNLSVAVDRFPERGRHVAQTATAAISAGVSASLAWASWDFVMAERRESPVRIGGWLPQWGIELILPVAFAVMALRFAMQPEGRLRRGLAFMGVPAAAAVGFLLAPVAGKILWPGILLLAGSALLGAPLFVVMGGTALLLFFAEGSPAASIPVEIYRLVVSPSLPSVPLFTLAGFILAEGKAGERLLRVFQALFGWMPGGLAVVAVIVCAFFTTFTGASGVTILALGGLLLPMFLQAGYREGFSVGLLTSSGSVGLLLPPSLPVILYAVQAKVAIPALFQAALVPGVLLVAAVAVLGVVEAVRSKVPRIRFDAREAARAFWAAKGEVLLPVVALAGVFGGWFTLVESAALTVAYALFVGVVAHREIHPWRDLPRVLVSAATLVGGVIAILGSAMGLTSYLVIAEVPAQAAGWIKARVASRGMFLLALNAFLLVVGALMDVYSAILVVVPLILPAAEAFGIDPLHLGVVFLVNLELGFLTPPVGTNLFLASYRFGKPVMEIALRALPFILAMLAVLLLTTYVPALSLWGAGGTGS